MTYGRERELYLGVVLTAAFLATQSACAQTDLGTHTLRVSAELVNPTCTLAFPNGDTANLSMVGPSMIANAPTMTDASAVTYIRANSMFGDLIAPYKSSNPAMLLEVSCVDASGYTLNAAGRYSLTFGSAAQMLPGNLTGAAAGGYAYRLDTGGQNMKQNLGFVFHVKDRYGSASGGQNALVKPGTKVAFINNQTFAPAGGGTYKAIFEVSPGFFWVNASRATEGSSFEISLIATLEFN